MRARGPARPGPAAVRARHRRGAGRLAPGLSAAESARLRRDVEELAATERGSATPGEVAAAEWGARRLREVGARDVRVERFRYPGTYAWRHAAYMAAGIAGAAAGGAGGAALAAGALASLELDFAGRSQWLARLEPRGEGANAVGVVPADGASGAPRTLVLVAHHDTARTGLAWRHPWLGGVGTNRRIARLRGRPGGDVMDSLTTVPKLALLAAAAGCATGSRRLRAGAAATLAFGAALALDVARSPHVPGASDNATGVAAVLALTERFAREPLPGIDVVALLTGCEESGMGGMAAWLRGAQLDPATTLVLGLDTLGAGEPLVVSAEGSLRPWRYRERDLAWADRGADRAGLPRPQRVQLGGWTDPLLAVHAGLPAVSILSARDGWFTNYHQPTDTPDRVDWDSVDRCVQLAFGTAAAWAGAEG